MRTVLLATNNKGKITELQRLLGSDFEVKTLKDFNINVDPEETGKTYKDNALIKAKAIREEVVKKGINAVVIADDSGLIVDALPGKLGVYTARYSGDKNRDTLDHSNNVKLLKEMQGVKNRAARYTVVMCVITEDGTTNFFAGNMNLEVGTEMQEGKGFAFDFVVKSTVYNRYVCRLTHEEKDRISHRGIAIRKVRSYLLNETKERKRIVQGNMYLDGKLNLFLEEPNGRCYAVVQGESLLSTPTTRKEVAQRVYHNKFSYTEDLHLYKFRKRV